MGRCGVMLERVVWDERVMCIAVWLVNSEDEAAKWESANRVAHITVGTASPAVKPKESNDLLARWSDGNKEGLDEERVNGIVVLDGIVRGVLQKY